MDDFSAFTKLRCFKTDYILRLLAFSSSFNIRFGRPLASFQSVDVFTPIHKLFLDSPLVYAKSIRHLRLRNITYFEDCLSNDGLTVLPFRDVILKLSPDLPFRKAHTWFNHMVNVATVSNASIRLKPQFIPHPSLVTGPDFLDTVMIPSRSVQNSFWCATWDRANDSPIFGRIYKTTPQKVFIQHWLRDIVPTSSSIKTPQSQQIQLLECQGCSLQDSAARKGKSNKRTADLPCFFVKDHDQVLDLKHLSYADLKRTSPNLLRANFLQLSHAIRASFGLLPDTLLGAHGDFPSRPSPPVLSCVLDFSFRADGGSASFLPVTKPSRVFVSNLFDAYNFSSLLNLHRWSRISFFNGLQLINWAVTWSLFNHRPDSSKSSTSFAHSAKVVFYSKLMLDELPLLHLLQTSRRPDLYMADWNCILCHQDKETWSHLWQCPVLLPLFKELLVTTKKTFELWITSVNESRPAALIPPGWDTLDCWRYPSSDTSVFSFDNLLKGFVPAALVQTLSISLPKAEAVLAVQDIMTESKQVFWDRIWKLRCHEFHVFELSEGITQAKKNSRYSRSQSDSRSSSTTARSVASRDSRWKSWISQSLIKGSPWMGFRIRINSLIF